MFYNERIVNSSSIGRALPGMDHLEGKDVGSSPTAIL